MHSQIEILLSLKGPLLRPKLNTGQKVQQVVPFDYSVDDTPKRYNKFVQTISEHSLFSNQKRLLRHV